MAFHQTDCGMMTFKDEDLANKVREDLGVAVSGRDFLTFSDPKQSVQVMWRPLETRT